MAVTKISRISRWTLYALTAVTLALLAAFFFGGSVLPENQFSELVGLPEPNFTNGLLYWIYALLGLTVLAVFAFSIVGFVNNFKKALNSLVMLVIFAVLLIIAYSIGDGTQLNILGYEGPDNVAARLKMTDMWIYSVYILMGLVILSMLLSPLIKRIGKRK